MSLCSVVSRLAHDWVATRAIIAHLSIPPRKYGPFGGTWFLKTSFLTETFAVQRRSLEPYARRLPCIRLFPVMNSWTCPSLLEFLPIYEFVKKLLSLSCSLNFDSHLLSAQDTYMNLFSVNVIVFSKSTSILGLYPFCVAIQIMSLVSLFKIRSDDFNKISFYRFISN